MGGKGLERSAGDLADSVTRVMRMLGATFRTLLENRDITWPQFHLLKIVKRNGRATVTELASMLMIAAPTTSRMIDNLCGKGLLSKHRDPGDHRLVHIDLTHRGRRLLVDMESIQNRALTDALKSEDPRDLVTCVETLNRISENLRHGPD